MSPDAVSISDSPASNCRSEETSSGVLPIVSDQTRKDACCSETSSGVSAAVSLPMEGVPGHGSACSHQSDSAASTSLDAVTMPDDTSLIDALRQVIDPELMINIVDLGLVYSINHTDRKVLVEMTLTSPACPAGPQIISQAKMSLEKLPGVESAEIKLTMSPPWTPDRMTDDARDQLGIF